MKRIILLVVILTFISVLLLTMKSDNPYPSLTNRDPQGYWAFGRYVTERSYPMERWRRPLADLPRPSMMIIAYPLKSVLTPLERQALLKYVSEGGHLVVLFKPGLFFSMDPPEVYSGLGFQVKKDPPVILHSYAEWRDYNLAGERLYPVKGPEEIVLVQKPASSSFKGARPFVPLLITGGGGVRAETRVVGKGRVTLFLDASIFDNAHFQQAGNADYFETFLAAYRPRSVPILFDEWHHGQAVAAVSGVTEHIFNLILVHLILLYLLGLFILRRRFSPPPPPQGRLTYSFVDFIRSLSRIHRQAGHEAGARGALIPILDKLYSGKAAAILSPLKGKSFLQLMQTLSEKEDSHGS